MCGTPSAARARATSSGSGSEGTSHSRAIGAPLLTPMGLLGPRTGSNNFRDAMMTIAVRSTSMIAAPDTVRARAIEDVPDRRDGVHPRLGARRRGSGGEHQHGDAQRGAERVSILVPDWGEDTHHSTVNGSFCPAA